MDCGYRIRPREVVHETIAGEVIIIQLARGNYFSLGGSGTTIWVLLGAGLGHDGIVAAFADTYGIDPAQAEAAVAPVLASMVGEGLIEETAEPAPASPPAPEPVDGAYEPPKLEKYSDMQDFLLIDPVHEVSEVGWPSPAD